MMAAMRQRPEVIDGVIAAAFLPVLLGEVLASDLREPRWPAAVLAAAMAVSLAWRRRAPLTSYTASSVAVAVQAVLFFTSPLYPYANLVGIYSVGAYATRQRAQAGLAVGLAGVATYFSAADFGIPLLPLLVGVIWTIAWAAGYGAARRREEAEARRAADVTAAAADERARMARELHDLIGHTVNVMVVQAGAARRVLDREPDRARTSLEAIEQVGRSALDELDRVLGVLRGEGPDPRAPQPGLPDIDALATRFADAGLAVSVSVEGTPPGELPRSLDVSAFRILQEALTNTLKHASARRAEIRLRYTADALELEVRDDGVGVDHDGARPGRGLVGIAERVALFGGRLEHGPGPDGGFVVRATLPVRSP